MPKRISRASLRNSQHARDVLYLGRGVHYPIALEGALKLKEISYIHAEGYAAGELKHGPIALIDEDTPVVVVAPHDALFEKTLSNMQEVAARGGRLIVITDPAGAAVAKQIAQHIIEVPACDPFVAPLGLFRADPVARLPHGGAQRHGRGPAA